MRQIHWFLLCSNSAKKTLQKRKFFKILRGSRIKSYWSKNRKRRKKNVKINTKNEWNQICVNRLRGDESNWELLDQRIAHYRRRSFIKLMKHLSLCKYWDKMFCMRVCSGLTWKMRKIVTNKQWVSLSRKPINFGGTCFWNIQMLASK